MMGSRVDRPLLFLREPLADDVDPATATAAAAATAALASPPPPPPPGGPEEAVVGTGTVSHWDIPPIILIASPPPPFYGTCALPDSSK